MTTFLFCLHFHLSNSCVCVCQLVYALPSPSTFIYNYRHIHMYIYNNYCIMINCNLNIPIMIRLCVPASKGFAQSLHTCDSMLKGFYFNIPTCLYFLWILPSHVHIKNVDLCIHLPFPYGCSQPIVYPHLFRPPKHVLTRESLLHQDSSIQTKRIHVIK